jgi:hypothetical protein
MQVPQCGHGFTADPQRAAVLLLDEIADDTRADLWPQKPFE